MRILILYRPNSEHGRMIEEFIHNFQDSHAAGSVEIQDVDSREGIATASLYDVMQYPAILALQPDGVAQRVWQGTDLPLMDEVASYANA
jgi:3-deoxy-D-manno-octulosonic acid (KDO) 8-phosphate synthase